MAVKLGFEAIKYVLTKVLTKKGSQGIARIPGKAYDMRMKQLVDEMAFKMRDLGYDINKVTEKEVQGLLDSAEALAKQKKQKVISQGHPEFQGITDKLLGKQKKPTIEGLAKGEKYTDERGRVWDFGTEDRPFPGANLKAVPKVTIDEHITFIKSKEPIESMKEANKVIKREGRYKNLTNEESQKILKDTDDHIFERDIKPDEFDPDYASGGRIGYAVGKLVKGGKWFLKNLKKAYDEIIEGKGAFAKLDSMQREDLKWQVLAQIKQVQRGGPIPDEAIKMIRQDPKFANVSKTRSTDPDLYEFEDVILNYGKKGDVSDQTIKEITDEVKDVSEKMILEDFTPTGKGHATGGRVPLMYGGDPGFAFEYGGSWADWHDQHRDQMPVEQYIKTKLPKDRLPFREMQSGGLAYMLGEPTYSIGGSVGHAPWHKPTGQQQPQQQLDTPTPNIATRPDPMKAPRGLPSLAPRTMDPQYMQQQAMQKAMMGQGQQRMGMDDGGMTPTIPEQFLEDFKRRKYEDILDEYRRWKEDYERRKDLAPTQEAAGGGRIGFGLGGIDKGRRAFMKWLAGIVGTGVAAGTGLIKLGKAAKVVPKVTETIVQSNAAGMPAWFPSLVRRVIKEGEDVGKSAGAMERQTIHRATTPGGTPIEVMHDLTSGHVAVDIGKQTKHGWGSGRHGQPVRLFLQKGEWIEPTKGKKGIKTKDEFFVEEAEFTGGHPENVKFEDVSVERYGDHASDFTEIEKYAVGKNIDKKIVGKKAKSDAWAEGRAESAAEDIDYASGGLAYMLGE